MSILSKISRLLFLGVVFVLLSTESFGQLLYRPIDPYANYAIEGYRRTGRQIQDRLTSLLYDDFGNLILDGIEVYRLSESRPAYDNLDTPGREPGSILHKSRYYQDYLNRLIVASDSYKGRSTKLIIGDHIRTRFTSLTLDKPSLNGIRLDSDMGRHKFSIVTSRLDRPVYKSEGIFGYEEGFYSFFGTAGLTEAQLATYLLGGHWESQLGIFKVGASYVNQYRMDTQVGVRGTSLKGNLPIATNIGGLAPVARTSQIDYIVAKFSDASEKNGLGVRVFDVRIFINGKRREDIVPKITRHDTEAIDRTYPNSDKFFPPNRMIPPYVQFIRGEVPTETPVKGGYLEAKRTGYLLYWFEIPNPQGVQSISFEALVANDYKISLSEVYIRDPSFREDEPRDRNRATYFYDVLVSERRVNDMSNLKWVRFSYGRQTGVTIAGMNISAEVKGFQMKAEYERNFEFRQYPNAEGKRHNRYSSAYYLNLKKDYRKFSVGSEYFNISPYYNTVLSIQDISYSDYTGPYLAEIGHPFDEAYNTTIDFYTVDDNDDKDPFPDQHFLSSQSDNNGVFPGLDEDHDGRPDTNENNNDIPDYLEAFLLYKVDPDEFIYGDDLNNNDVPDEREDDDKPDYPYDIGLRGYNLFTHFNPVKDLQLIVGRYNTRDQNGGGISISTYGKAQYNKYVPFLGQIKLNNFLKKVKDDIPNDVFKYGYDHTFGPVGTNLPAGALGVNKQDLVGAGITVLKDQLLMKNSVVNTSFLEWKFIGMRDFHLSGNLKYDLNWQRSTSMQEVNFIRRWTSVIRSDYVLQYKGFTVRPQAKFMVQRLSDQKSAVLSIYETFFYPILRVDYAFTPKTVLKTGVQGMPFLKSMYHNLLNSTVDYSSEDYVVMITNSSSYSGYELSFNIGYQIKKLRLSDRSRRSEDADYSLFFIRLIVGLRPYEAR